MATKRFYVLDTPEDKQDAILQTRDNVNFGRAYIQDAPNGQFLNCSLDNHWIITDEEHKLFNQLKKKQNGQ